MSQHVDEVWQWLHEPLQQLKYECRENSETPFEERFSLFLNNLGVSSPDDHPVLRMMVDHVGQLGEHEQQVAFLSDDELDTHVYYWAQMTVSAHVEETHHEHVEYQEHHEHHEHGHHEQHEHGHREHHEHGHHEQHEHGQHEHGHHEQHEQHADHVPGATAVAPDEAAEQVVRLIAIPAVTEMAASHPELIGQLSGEEITETLSLLLAERLASA
jgi:hypothetical protein